MRGVGDEVASRALELGLGGDVAQDDDRGEVGLAADGVGQGLERALAVDEDDVLDIAAAPRLVPDVGDVVGEGTSELGADRKVAPEEFGRGGVGDRHAAVGRDADHALAEIVEEDLDAVLLELDLGEGVAQALGHRVERLAELPDLVLEADGHGHGEIAARHRLGARLDPLQTGRR